ncbi:RraA family protein [Paraburkholderia sp. 22B1P]|uniref:RraA family protein n=1 Tax=Paraburkholderia sp. 22B1P TaxID=3080498 RepID=UPI00308E9109|nr:RraA family protein [Paraburkholderia sp. 22B1P]
MRNLGFRIEPASPETPPEVIDLLRGKSVSHLSDVMHRSRTTGAFRLYSKSSQPMCGPAFTVRVQVGDHLLLQKSLDLARRGDVIVVDAQGFLEVAMVGEIMTRYAASRGIAGFVIDGAIRDLDYVSGQTLHVYARGVTPAGPTRRGPGEVNPIIKVGGMLVAPGDVVCGDMDGLVSVPVESAVEVAKLADALAEKEKASLAAIEAGNLDRTWIDTALTDNGFRAD